MTCLSRRRIRRGGLRLSQFAHRHQVCALQLGGEAAFLGQLVPLRQNALAGLLSGIGLGVKDFRGVFVFSTTEKLNQFTVVDGGHERRPDVVGVSVRNIDNNDLHAPVYFLRELRPLLDAVRSRTDAPIVLGGVNSGATNWFVPDMPTTAARVLVVAFDAAGKLWASTNGSRLLELAQAAANKSDHVGRKELAHQAPGLVAASFSPPYLLKNS